MFTEQWLVKLCSGVHISVLREIALVLEICSPSISFTSSFIENGGDSLACLKLHEALREIGIDIPFERILTTSTIYELLRYAESRAKIARTTKSLKRRSSMADQVSEAKRPQRKPLMAPSAQKRRASASGLHPQHRFPMTKLQVDFLQSSLKYPNRNIIQYFEIHRSEHIALLKVAWQTVVEMEPIFRMKFELCDGAGYMTESALTNFQWEEVTVGTYNAFQEEAEKEDWDDKLEEGYPVNSFKIVIYGSKSKLVWRIHHVLIDEHSRNLLLSKIQQYISGKTVSAGPSFAEFALQLQVLQAQFNDVGTTYWEKQQGPLSRAASTLLVPTPVESASKPLEHVEIHTRVSELDILCKRTNITLASLYYAAWAMTLTGYVDSDDVCFGAVFCGRATPLPGYKNTIGPTINSLPLCISIDRRQTVERWLHHVFRHVTQLFSLQWSTPETTPSKQFQSALNVQLTHDRAGDSSLNPIEIPWSTIMSDIPLQIDISRNGKIRFSYHTEVFTGEQIWGIADTFSQTLAELQVANRTVAECVQHILPKTHRIDLSRFGNWEAATTRHGTVKTDLVQLFVETAQKNPEDIAISRGHQTLTYAELDRRSTAIARKIAPLISDEDVIGVHADCSIEWVVAMYGVLKAHGVYCPFIDDMPSAIRDVNFQTANAKVFLTGNDKAKIKKPRSCNVCFSVEEILADNSEPTVTKEITFNAGRPNAAAYLCFTSGSTGKPKGVLCRHGGLVAFQSNFNVRLRARSKWKIAQTMSPAFDGSIHEIFSALSYGAELHLKDHSDPFGHIKVVDAAILTPSIANVLDPNEYPHLSTLYLVGEAVSQSLCDRWSASRVVYNMYGPTEATCGATIKQLHPDRPVTLGIPNPTTRIYILDKCKQLVSPGVIGEVYLAGIQVAAGYVGRPEETARRFLPDSVHPHLHEEMYRTGDRGYWSEYGELMFLGRADRQIKLRGFRIDLDDIEIRILQSYSTVKGVAITLKNDHLVAQVQPANINLSDLMTQIRKHVPVYAVPRYIMAVDSFPLTRIGKLDYKKVAAQDYNSAPVKKMDILQSSMEIMVVSVVREVLSLPEDTYISLNSSFAGLGGHSLLHLRLSHRFSAILHRHVPLRLILLSPSLKALAASLQLLQATVELVNSNVNSQDEHQLSPIEMDWWCKHKYGSSSSFNVTYACQLGPQTNTKLLADAWNVILSRHRVLSSSYHSCVKNGAWREYHQSPPTVQPRDYIDIQQEIHVPFDLSKDYLVRVFVSPTQMLVVISHTICDLTTLRILLEEVLSLYLGNPLNPIKKQYFQVHWLTPGSSYHLPFWTKYLSDQTAPCYPIGNNTQRKTWQGTSHFCSISSDTYKLMHQFVASHKITMHQLALGAVALALQHSLDICDITLGAPYLNRHTEDDQATVGLFLEPLPIRILYDTNCTTEETFIESVQRSSRAALGHAVPWHQLLSHLNTSPNYPEHPLIDVMVTFHDKADQIEFLLPGAKSLTMWTEGAKFKIMAEFAANGDMGLTLRLEYSTECFQKEDMKQLEQWIGVALHGIVKQEDYNSICEKIRQMKK